MANDLIDYPTPEEIREVFSQEKIGHFLPATPGLVTNFRMAMGEEPIQIRVYAPTPEHDQFLVRTIVNDGGSSYLSQYGGVFQTPEATALFINAVIADVKEQ